MRLKDISLSTLDMFRMDPMRIETVEGFNVRGETPALAAHLLWLKESIRQNGVQTPLTIRLEGEKVLLVDGHTRLRAVKELISEGVEFPTGVPCVPEGRNTTHEARTLRLLTANNGLPLSALEKAEVFHRLMTMGLSVAMIATQSGYTTKQVQNLLTLEDAPDEVREAVRDGQVSATEAIKTVRKHGAEDAPRVLAAGVARAKNEGKSRATAKILGAPRFTRRRGEEMMQTMQAALDVDDVVVIHTMIRDCLAAFDE